MKNLFFSVILTFVGFCAMATTAPEEIQPKTKIIRPSSWYVDQAERWKQQTQSHSADPSAWFNYYMAARYANASQDELSAITRAAIKSIPNTFESKIIEGVDKGFTEGGIQLLVEAYRSNPERATAFGPLLLSHEWNLDETSRKEFSKKLFASGNVSQSLLSYSYNVLMSLSQNTVLFVDGDNTTLPLFVLQDVMNVRTDVVILNLDLLMTSQYRERKLSKLGLSFINAKDFESGDKKQLCKLIPEQNPRTKFYYALTVARENVSSINDQLYVVGLASQLSKERLDNISIIKENLEDRFLMDYLLVDFNGESEFASGRVLSSNYLVPMLLLREQYIKDGNREKSQALEILVTKVAASSGKEALVRNILMTDDDKVPFFPFELEQKAVDGSMRMVSNALYAQDHEVTVEEYNTFLRYLLDNNLNDLYDKYKFDLTSYSEPALSFLKGYSSAGNAGKKTKQHFPAVNVPYAAALAYCEWLTEHYNKSSDRKYKKVKFRLPKLNEWQIAAASLENPVSWNLDDNSATVKITPDGKMGGKDFTMKTIQLNDPEILYPWFRFYAYKNKPMNNFGCYLGNFKVPEGYNACQARNKTITADGWMAMAPVQSYFPNDIGLFDVVGNVAEMLDEEGKAAGGSWNHPPEESTIRSINEYKGSDSAIGFRIFMDLIEK